MQPRRSLTKYVLPKLVNQFSCCAYQLAQLCSCWKITVPALTNGQVRIPVLSGEGVADVSVDGQPLDSPPPSISFHGEPVPSTADA